MLSTMHSQIRAFLSTIASWLQLRGKYGNATSVVGSGYQEAERSQSSVQGGNAAAGYGTPANPQVLIYYDAVSEARAAMERVKVATGKCDLLSFTRKTADV